MFVRESASESDSNRERKCIPEYVCVYVCEKEIKRGRKRFCESVFVRLCVQEGEEEKACLRVRDLERERERERERESVCV